MFKNWPLWWKVLATIGGILVGVAGIISAFYAVRTYHYPPNPPAQNKTTTNPKNEGANLTNNNPVKRDSHLLKHSQSPALHSKDTGHSLIPTKERTITKQTSINASDSNIFTGSNSGTVNQTVNINKEKPLRERIIDCLNRIDTRFIPELRVGHTKFKGTLSQNQVAELQKLSAEDESHKYIALLTFDNEIVVLAEGTYTTVHIELRRLLIE